ncbi:hypothetical protein KUCAC02_020544, partial [Chaenocephalus aceratus]
VEEETVKQTDSGEGLQTHLTRNPFSRWQRSAPKVPFMDTLLCRTSGPASSEVRVSPLWIVPINVV